MGDCLSLDRRSSADSQGVSVVSDRDEVGRRRAELAGNGAVPVNDCPALPAPSQECPAPPEADQTDAPLPDAAADPCPACTAESPTVTAQHGRKVYYRCSRCGLLWRIEQEELVPRTRAA
jgi:hypothetical protein